MYSALKMSSLSSSFSHVSFPSAKEHKAHTRLLASFPASLRAFPRLVIRATISLSRTMPTIYSALKIASVSALDSERFKFKPGLAAAGAAWTASRAARKDKRAGINFILLTIANVQEQYRWDCWGLVQTIQPIYGHSAVQLRMVQCLTSAMVVTIVSIRLSTCKLIRGYHSPQWAYMSKDVSYCTVVTSTILLQSCQSSDALADVWRITLRGDQLVRTTRAS